MAPAHADHSDLRTLGRVGPECRAPACDNREAQVTTVAATVARGSLGGSAREPRRKGRGRHGEALDHVARQLESDGRSASIASRHAMSSGIAGKRRLVLQ